MKRMKKVMLSLFALVPGVSVAGSGGQNLLSDSKKSDSVQANDSDKSNLRIFFNSKESLILDKNKLSSQPGLTSSEEDVQKSEIKIYEESNRVHLSHFNNISVEVYLENIADAPPNVRPF